MTKCWALHLRSPKADPLRPVAGLPIVLRLALDAQAAGASRIVLGSGLETSRAALGDARLRLPVVEQPDPGEALVEVEAHLVVHREVLRRHAALAIAAPGGASGVSPSDSAPAPFGFSPIEVCDQHSARRAERALFRSLRKPADGWTSRWLNRYISLSISRWLVHTPLSPNQVSVGILAFGVASAALASRGDYVSLVAAAACLQAQSVLDGCDGELSRVTHRGSLLGEWLDTIGDDISNYGFFAGAAWGLFQSTGVLPYLIAGAVIVVAGAITSGLEYRYLWQIGSGDLLKYPLSAQTSNATGLLGALQPLFKRDTFVFITFLAALGGLVGPMLLVFSLGAVGILANVLATERRLARNSRTASAPKA